MVVGRARSELQYPGFGPRNLHTFYTSACHSKKIVYSQFIKKKNGGKVTFLAIKLHIPMIKNISLRGECAR